jgi:nitroreductase
MLEKRAETSVPIHELLGRRWSPRAYDGSRAVTHEELIALLEAARWAPSCNGDEPWRYLVWNRASDGAGWEKAYVCLAPANQVWVSNAPVLMLSCAASKFAYNGNPNRFAQHDTGMANLSIALQAVALGLVAHQMAGFDAEKARAAFNIPGDYTPMAMIAIGGQADPATLPDEVKAKELAPRKRRPLGERFFAGTWGSAIR